MDKKPKHFLVFKIIAVVGIAVLIGGLVLIITGFGDFESNNFMIGGIMMPVGLFIGVTGFMFGFAPEISKMSAKSAKYIQNENKQDLMDIANTRAEIMEGAVTKTAKAFKEGFAEDTKYCKHCGAVIDADSKFCSKCGKEQ